MSDDAPRFISYGEWGERFFSHAVTEERVRDGVGGLAGRRIAIGPMGVGPVGLVKVSAEGEVGTPSVAAREGSHVAFDLGLPVDLRLVIDTGLDKSRFTAAVLARLALTARAAEPLRIVIEVAEPRPEHIDVTVSADGLRASVLQVVAGVDREIRKAVARYIRREVTRPELVAARTIDVGSFLGAFSVGSRTGSARPAD